MAFKSKDGLRVESVYFNGYKYNRYPDSPNKTHQRYFGRAGHFLHRDVWEHFNGPIPEGYQIHHKDENTVNNDISNLECLPPKKHRAEHHAGYVERGRSEKQQNHLKRIREKAAAWHSSPEGIAWHREHAKNSVAKEGRAPAFSKTPYFTRDCEWCGGQFKGRSQRKILCSAACQLQKSAYLRGKNKYVHPHWAEKKRP